MSTRRSSPKKAARADVDPVYTNLTQPAELAEDWAMVDYTKPVLMRPGGIHRGFLILRSRNAEPKASTIGGYMLTKIYPQEFALARAIHSLTRVRQEWEEIADGSSLVEVKASVGYLLADIVLALSLEPSEQIQVLGQELYTELQDILVVVPENGRGS